MARILEIYFGVLIFIFLNFIFTSSISAVSITINSFPETIDSLDSYLVNATISGATNATNYLRVDLYKDGTNNYFGETYNGSDWYGGGDGKSYYPIQVQNSSASAEFYFQLGNPSSTQYTGPGIYKLKIRRYTSSGSASSNDVQTPQDVQIKYIFSTPIPTPNPTPTVDPTTPTPIPTPPSKTPTPTPVLIKAVPTLLINKTILPVPTQSGISTASAKVLGLLDSGSSAVPVSNENPVEGKNSILAVILIFIGIVIVGVAFYFAFKLHSSSQSQNDIMHK